jgi:hypothetical protein
MDNYEDVMKQLEALNCDSVLVGDSLFNLDSESQINDETQIFLDALFGRKRLQVIRVNGNKTKVLSKLKSFSQKQSIEISFLDGNKLDADFIRGEIELNTVDGYTTYDRKIASYITENKQMIVIENLNEQTDLEVLRAFMYMGSLGSYWDDLENLPEDKLPYGSGFVFIAEEDFPLIRFASISDSWRSEAAILDMRNFRTRITEHLGQYKKNKLKIIEPGEYLYNGEIKLYDHILPKDEMKLNIIEKYRDDFFNSSYAQIKFHRYAHHLNSSQAMCINFFYPLIQEELLEKIAETLRIPGHIIYNSENVCFEKESELEPDGERKTNFDFFIKLDTGVKIYFEIKYTESEFGKAKNDGEHQAKFQRTYQPLLEKCDAIKEAFKNEAYFLNNYQIMRNILHIDKDSYVVFIYPQKNVGFRTAALQQRKDVVTSEYTSHFVFFTWEGLLEQLEYRLKDHDLKKYYASEFRAKYLVY